MLDTTNAFIPWILFLQILLLMAFATLLSQWVIGSWVTARVLAEHRVVHMKEAHHE